MDLCIRCFDFLFFLLFDCIFFGFAHSLLFFHRLYFIFYCCLTCIVELLIIRLIFIALCCFFCCSSKFLFLLIWILLISYLNYYLIKIICSDFFKNCFLLKIRVLNSKKLIDFVFIFITNSFWISCFSTIIAIYIDYHLIIFSLFLFWIF